MTMPDFWTMLSAPPVHLLGWTLLHFVWQGALVAALLAGALRLFRTHPPRVRYVVSMAALVTLIALPVATTGVLSGHLGQERAERLSVGRFDETVAAAPVPTGPTTIPDERVSAPSGRTGIAAWLHPVLPWMVLVWGVGVLGCAARLAGGAWRVRRIRQSSTPVSTEWRERTAALIDGMNLRRSVTLRRSPHVDSPMVVGWWRPIILVPAGVLSGFPPAQVEALLRHELAHVRRHDVLVGHLQAVVEVLLFFHPATWWVSRTVRQTREACCDDLVVREGTERTVYAKALTTLAEQAVAEPAPVPTATGGSLLTRIQRVLSPTSGPSAHVQQLSMAAAVLLLVGVPLGLAACASQQPATETQDESVAEGPTSPDQPPEDAEEQRVVVVERDSTERRIQVDSSDSVRVDRSGDGVYVLRHGGRTDTLDPPKMEDLPELGELEELERGPKLPFDPDSMKRALRLEIDVDSLEREIRAHINPDSLERAIHARINVDSLEHEVQMHVSPDGLEKRALRMRRRIIDAGKLARRFAQHADSLTRAYSPHDSLTHRWERHSAKQLREQARRLEEQARRLEERAREMEGAQPNEPSSP